MNPWAAIVGRGKHGKRAAVHAAVEALRTLGLTVGGVLQTPVGPVGERDGYDLVDLATGGRAPLARRSPQPEVCEWAFSPDVFATARAWAAAAAADVVIAEVGHLEARGEGLWPLFADALAAPRPCVALMVVRPDVLTEVALRLPDPLAGLELPAEPEAIARFAEALARREGVFL